MTCKCKGGCKKDGWMNGVLGHFYTLSRLNWAGMQKGGHYDVQIKRVDG